MKNLHQINSILKVKSLAADPVGADESGLIYFNTTLNVFRLYDGTAWAAVTVGGSPDLSSYFKKDGSVVATGAFQMGTFKISGMADPTLAQDAATKNYVDNSTGNAANKTLSNLTAPTALGVDLLPGTTGINVGSPTGNTFDNFYANRGLQLKSGGGLVGPNQGIPAPDGSTPSINVFNNSAGSSAITTEAGYSGTVASQPILIQTGNTVDGLSGDIKIRTGIPTGTGTRGSVNISALNLNMNSSKIINLLDPTLAQDAATKNYVDTAITTGTAAYIPLSQKGANNGVATLDAGGKVPVAQLPSAVMTYEGTWNASTNTPTLANGTGDAGMVYITSVAGTANFGAGAITFAAGDWVVYNGTIWEKSINSNAVASVNGQTGIVTLTTTNIAEGTNLYFTNARAIASVLTGYVSGAGTISAADTVLSAIQKLNGNIAAIDFGPYLRRDGTVSIQGVLAPDGSGTRNLGTVTNQFATGYFKALRPDDSGSNIDLVNGILTSGGGFDTINWTLRKLVSGTVTSMSWGNGGIELYDSAFAIARDITGVGKIDLVSGANLKNVTMSSNRSAVILAAGTSTISLPTSLGVVITYRAFRSTGGTETKTGTICIAKETTGSNTNSSISETSTSTNVTLDSVVFSVGATGGLFITNNTAFSIEVRVGISIIQ